MNQPNLLNETFKKHLGLMNNKLNLNEVGDNNPLNDIPIQSAADIDYSDANPSEVVSIKDMERYIKYAKIFVKMFKFILPSDFSRFLSDVERDVAKIKQLSSTQPFNKNAYIAALSSFKKKYGKVLKP